MSELSVDLKANTDAAVAQVKKLGAAFEDTATDMEKLVDAGQDLGKSTDDISRDLSKVSGRPFDEVRRDVERAEASIDDMADEADNARKAVSRIGDAGQDAGRQAVSGMDKIRASSKEVGEEVRQNLGEGIANAARGDFESLADTIGDTLGGAVAGIGGIGAAGVAAAGALGIGALIGALVAAEEKLTLTRERATELAQVMYENQGKIPLTDRVSELVQLLGSERIATNPFEHVAKGFVDLGTTMDRAKDVAENAEIPLNRILRGLTGADIGATKGALAAVNEELERMGQEAGNVDLADFGERQNALNGLKTELESVVEQTKLANELYSSTEFMNRDRLDQLAEAWRGAATDAGDYFAKTEEGATTFDWSTYLTDAEATIAAAEEMKARLVGLPDSVRAEAERIFSEQGAVAANEYTRAYEGASAADRGRFEAAASANGVAAGAAQSRGLKDAFGAPILDAVVRVRRDTRDWDNWQPSQKTGVIMATRARNLPEWE